MTGALRTILVAASCAEAVAAIHGTVTARTERNLGFLAAGSASSRMHFALVVSAAATESTTGLFAGCSASRATAGFIGETLFRKEVLFRSRENEFGAAIAAG